MQLQAWKKILNFTRNEINNSPVPLHPPTHSTMVSPLTLSSPGVFALILHPVSGRKILAVKLTAENTCAILEVAEDSATGRYLNTLKHASQGEYIKAQRAIANMGAAILV